MTEQNGMIPLTSTNPDLKCICLQVSDKERQAQQEALFKDVATIVSEKCVNPETKVPYPVSIIEKAMKECHVAVKANKGAKQQAVETVAKLKAQLPIERAQMRLRISVPLTSSKKVTAGLKKIGAVAEKEDRTESDVVTVCLVDPGQYR